MLPVAHRIFNWYILTWYIALDKELYAFVTAISNHVILLSEAVCSYHVITPFIIRCIYVYLWNKVSRDLNKIYMLETLCEY